MCFFFFSVDQSRAGSGGQFLDTFPSGTDRYKMRRKSDCGFVGGMNAQQLQHLEQQQVDFRSKLKPKKIGYVGILFF